MDVIIPTKNCAQDLQNCLRSLEKQLDPVRVIVVDAHSTDGTREVAVSHGADLIDEPPSTVKGSRRAVALNEGLRHSLSPVVAFVDADTIVPRQWSRVMGLVMGKWGCSAASTGAVTADSDIGRAMMWGSTHAHSYPMPRKLESVPGYNSVYLRRAIDEAGGFCEELGGCEDWELNSRIRRNGGFLMGIPGAPVEHKERQTLSTYSRQMWGYGWSWGRMLRVKGTFKPTRAIPAAALILGAALLAAQPIPTIMAALMGSPLLLINWVKVRATMILYYGTGYLRGIVD